jgi:hypothetical protein
MLSQKMRGLSLVTLLFGLGALGSGIGSLMGLANPTYVRLDVPTIVALDNNLRFYAGLWFAMGLMALWLAPRLEREATLFRALFVALFAGGCGRVLSMVFAGLPPPEFIAYAVLEVLGAPLVLYWHHMTLRNEGVRS